MSEKRVKAQRTVSKSANPSKKIAGRAKSKAASQAREARAANRPDIEKMIAEAAYYLSERRGFNSQFDQQNWFEAESRIRSEFELQ